MAIDADPDANLAESLGVEYKKTIGDLREEVTESKTPAGVDKQNYVSGKAFEATVEADGFDLLVMGRPEGPGCYCALNHILRNIIDETTKAYDYTIVDAEAGLEHLSRRTTQNVDIMIVVSDASVRGIHTAEKIRELAGELDIKFGELYLVLNRMKGDREDKIKSEVDKAGIKVLGEIPEDDAVREYDAAGRPLAQLPEDSKAYKAVLEITKKIR